MVRSIRAEGPSAGGTVKAVDASKNTLTLSNKEGDQSFTVAPDAPVILPGFKKAGKLTDLPIGAMARVRLSLDGKQVIAIHADGPSSHGSLKSFDAAKGTIIVADKLGEKVLNLAKGVSISIDGKPAKLADVPADAQVTLQLSPDQTEVVAIHAEGPGVEGPLSGNAGVQSLTVSSKLGDESYSLPAEPKVLIVYGGKNTREGKLDDLIDGTVVSFKLSADRKGILGPITAKGPSYHGIVKVVDATGGNVTLLIGSKNGEGGEEKTFKLGKETKVLTEALGAEQKLADVKVDQEVALRLSIDQKTIDTITLPGQ